MHDALVVNDLIQKLSSDEITARAARGLPTQHIETWEHFPVAFALETLAQLNDASARLAANSAAPKSSMLVRSFVQLLTKDVLGADAEISAYQNACPNDPMGQMRFSYLPGPIHGDLPQITGSLPRVPAFFVGCDKRYLQALALPLLRSMATQAPGLPVHLHLMDPNPRLAERLERLDLSITVTTEDPSAYISQWGIKPELYYNAARVLRFAEAIAQGAQLCMIDADSLATGDPRSILANESIGLRVRPGRFEPFHQFSACLVMGRQDETNYFGTISKIIAALLHRPFWGLDQYALYAAYLQCKPRISLFGPSVVDVNGIGGTFAFIGGTEAKNTLATAKTPYAQLFRRYAGISS